MKKLNKSCNLNILILKIAFLFLKNKITFFFKMHTLKLGVCIVCQMKVYYNSFKELIHLNQVKQIV
jgi:hypothetical protein